ncbi:hypothetical protein AAVH_26522 [Aphelenchoides avenae]|nr:hypothetical protein AAVH_26522 [Aphelenchus avenae]
MYFFCFRATHAIKELVKRSTSSEDRRNKCDESAKEGRPTQNQPAVTVKHVEESYPERERPFSPMRCQGSAGATPRPPKRSFSGQFDARLEGSQSVKVPPCQRKMQKMNSEIILFAGEPYTTLPVSRTPHTRSH